MYKANNQTNALLYSLGSNTHYNNACEYYQSRGSYTTANYYRKIITAAVVTATTTCTSAVILCNTTTQYEYTYII